MYWCYLILRNMSKLTESQVPPQMPSSLPPSAVRLCGTAPKVRQLLHQVMTKRSSSSDGSSSGFGQQPWYQVQKLKLWLSKLKPTNQVTIKHMLWLSSLWNEQISLHSLTASLPHTGASLEIKDNLNLWFSVWSCSWLLSQMTHYDKFNQFIKWETMNLIIYWGKSHWFSGSIFHPKSNNRDEMIITEKNNVEIEKMFQRHYFSSFCKYCCYD